MERRSAGADGGAHSRKMWAPLDGTIGGAAKRVKQPLGVGYWAGKTATSYVQFHLSGKRVNRDLTKKFSPGIAGKS
jgi:hypothetical protein